MSTYGRLGVHVWASDRQVIKAASTKLKHKFNREERLARHGFYKRMLEEHKAHQEKRRYEMRFEGFVGFFVEVDGKAVTGYTANAKAVLKKAKELKGVAVADFKHGFIVFNDGDLSSIPKAYGGTK